MSFKTKIHKLFDWEVPQALPIKDFSKPGDFCWEDWHAAKKRAYPIKYIFMESIPDWMTSQYGKVERAIWFVRHHTDKRYHFLDLRQPKSNVYGWDYRHGWIDSDMQIVFACFNILCNFVEKEKGGLEQLEESIKWYTEHEDNDCWRDALTKVRDIYLWWKNDRLQALKEIDQLQDIWYKSRAKADMDKLEELEKQFDQDLDQKLKDLLDVRKYMWT